MASPSDILKVRRNTDEPGQETYTDDALSDLIDNVGVSRASATIWREKAAKYAALVDVSEAGASRQMSQLHEHAMEMVSVWDSMSDGVSSRIRVHKIVRS